MDMLTDEKLAELRAQHGALQVVEFVDDEDKTLRVALRRPVADLHDEKRDEFLQYLTRRFAIEQSGGRVPDPTRDGTAELLSCVVYPAPSAVRAHLADYPGDVLELRMALMELAGEVEEDKSLVTEAVKSSFHKRAVGFRAGGKALLVRPMSGPEYQTFVSKNGGRPYPFRAEALTWAAWSCAQEAPDKGGRKPDFEALLAEVPILGVYIGGVLVGKSQSRTVDREKK